MGHMLERLGRDKGSGGDDFDRRAPGAVEQGYSAGAGDLLCHLAFGPASLTGAQDRVALPAILAPLGECRSKVSLCLQLLHH